MNRKTDKITPWGMIASIGAANLGGFINGMNPNISTDNLLQNAGLSYGSVGGINYSILNYVDKDKELSEFHNDNLKSAISGNLLGALSGEIFGVSKYKDAIRDANILANKTNIMSSSKAGSLAMRLDNILRYGDQGGLVLYGKDGIDAMVQPGEVAVDGNGNGGIFRGGVPGKDSIHTKLLDDTAVLSTEHYFAQMAYPLVQYQQYLKSLVNKNEGGNKEIAEKVIEKEYQKTQDGLLDIAESQKQARQVGDIPVGDNDASGIVHAWAGWDNLLANGLSALSGIGQYISANKQSIKAPKTYIPNIYADRALRDMSALSINPFPIYNSLRNAENRGRYIIANSGGLSGAQKYLSNVLLTSNTQQNIYNTMMSAQQQNNAYKAAAAQAMLLYGAQDAANRMQTSQWDLDYYSKAHAARQQGMQMGQYNFINALQQYAANEYKRRQFENMYSLYSDLNEIEREKVKNMK